MIKKEETKNFGHPWTKELGWDLMEVTATTPEELNTFVKEQEQKLFWKPWIQGTFGTDEFDMVPGAVLYKPSDAACDWEDNPNTARVL